MATWTVHAFINSSTYLCLKFIGKRCFTTMEKHEESTQPWLTHCSAMEPTTERQHTEVRGSWGLHTSPCHQVETKAVKSIIAASKSHANKACSYAKPLVNALPTLCDQLDLLPTHTFLLQQRLVKYVHGSIESTFFEWWWTGMVGIKPTATNSLSLKLTQKNATKCFTFNHLYV